MPPSSRQRSYSEALDQEAGKLRTIAERLGICIERFETFMTSHEATVHAASVEMASLRGDTIDDQPLARQLQEERNLLIAAWEQLERENRNRLKMPEVGVRVESTPPQPQTKTNTDSPALPSQSVSETNISKRVQFQYLQREIDRRG